MSNPCTGVAAIMAAAAIMVAGGASEDATTAASGMAPDGVGTAAAGGPMASALAGGPLPSATFGYVVENNITGRFRLHRKKNRPVRDALHPRRSLPPAVH